MNLFQTLAAPALFRLDPETAHALSIRALACGLVPAAPILHDPRLETNLAGLAFPNPLGMAAGYDKNGEVPDALLRLGFGHVEIGSVTPRPQAGNPKPRIFRLPATQGVINRLGFNNDGGEAVLARLLPRAGRKGIVGINIGANKDSPDFIADYERGIESLWPVAGYFTVNISSPNTPGLRGMQHGDILAELLRRVIGLRDAKAKTSGKIRPVFLKIAPDLDDKALDDIAAAVIDSGLDGMIISNTTLSRHGLGGTQFAAENGGLSGKPLYERSTVILARMRTRIGPKMPIIGVGGVCDASGAIGKIEAGADLVQLYTGMIFRGPGLAANIVRGLINHLDSAGINTISELKGCKTQQWAKRKLPEENSP